MKFDKAICLSAVFAAFTVQASVALFDFETEDARRSAPNVRNESGMVVCVTNSMAPSGSWALHVTKPSWHEGMKDKMGVRVTLRPPVTDWRGYDRLVVDVFNDGPSGDWVYLRAVGPDDDWERGLYGRMSLPAYGYQRWVVNLKWPKGFDASNVTRMLINTSSMPKGVNMYLDGFRLLKPGEPLPEATGELFSRGLVPRYQRRITELEQMLEEAHGARRHDAALRRFRESCEKAGASHPRFCVGKASSAEQVLPRDDFSAEPAVSVDIRLARNEWEAVQLVPDQIGGLLQGHGAPEVVQQLLVAFREQLGALMAIVRSVIDQHEIGARSVIGSIFKAKIIKRGCRGHSSASALGHANGSVSDVYGDKVKLFCKKRAVGGQCIVLIGAVILIVFAVWRVVGVNEPPFDNGVSYKLYV